MGYLNQILHTYLFQYCPAKCMLNDDKGLLSIILAGQSILVKMLITLKTYILIKFCILIHFNIVETQVCKTGD